MTGSAPMPIGFTVNSLVRDGERRDDAALGAALARADGVYYCLAEDGWLCETGGERPEPAFSRGAAHSFREDAEGAVLLGHDAAGRPVLALPLLKADPLPETLKRIDLRSLASQGVLDPETEGRLAQGQHLLLWHRANGFCARCGGRTRVGAAGFKRRCEACGEEVFPRINPVTIMLIHDGADRCLLGRQPHFPAGMWSCLAGFVEAGETLEDAVRRETGEEAGIAVGAVRYLFSQPWPFPGNLMIGCSGLAIGTEIAFDGDELEDCRWFTREEATAMLHGNHPDGLAAPRPLAIAHHLLKAFVEARI